MKHFVFVFLIGVLFGTQAFAVEFVYINTSQQTYHYGDYLSVTIQVSEVTGSDGVLYIIDSDGTKSSSIPLKIRDKITTIVAQSPFDPLLFKEGSYQLQLDYDGTKSFAEFDLVDAGNIIMPYGSNVIVPEWIVGTISDYNFLKFLVDKNTVSLSPDHALSENTEIPLWYKTNAVWWTEKKISDTEFVNGLQYLLNNGIILY